MFMIFMLVVLLIMAAIDRLGVVNIPDWVVFIWLFLMLYHLYVYVTGNHVFAGHKDDTDDDDNEP